MGHTARLIRLEHSWTWGTFGMLLIDSRIFCATIEPPDALNLRNESSIPTGSYTCLTYSSDNHPETYQVINVPSRNGILFHAGNTKVDTAGCILLGSKHGKLGAARGTLNSGTTFSRFLDKMMGVNEFNLVIKEEY